MRLRKPTRAIIDQVRITREGNDAIMDYADSGIAGTRFTIGPDIATMTDREIIDVFNGILAAQERLLAAWEAAATCRVSLELNRSRQQQQRTRAQLGLKKVSKDGRDV